MHWTTIVLLIISVLSSFLVIYSDNYGLLKRGRLILSIAATAITLLVSLFAAEQTPVPLAIGFSIAPILIAGLYNIADSYSQRKHQRGFQLHARYSVHMNGLGLKKRNPHFSLSDKLFSFLLLMLTLGIPFLTVALLSAF